VDAQAEVAEFYALLRYPGPDALITYLWPNRVARFVPEGPFTFLDAGCGAGRHTAGMLDRYREARGFCFDLSRPSLDAAATLLEAKHFTERAQLWRASYLDPIRVSEPVDLALAVGTIHHCPDPARALTNIAAAVKPGGHVACMVYGARSHRRRYDIKEAIAMLAGDMSETEALYRSYQAKYASLLDTTPRVMLRSVRNRASHLVNRALGRKRHGYRTDQQTSVFILDTIASPIDVAFDTAGLRALVEAAGLDIVAMFGVGRHDASLLPQGWNWDRLNFWQKTRLSELLDPDPKSWSFIARKPL
jgi:SAM-dependent methyltransferase